MADENRLKELFASYEAIAIIANSETLDLKAVEAAMPERTLFVFFTRCMRVIRPPFTRDAVLIHLLNGELELNESEAVAAKARALFAGGALKTEIGLRVGRGGGALATAPGEASKAVPHTVDCSRIVTSWYTPRLAPTTGFAATLWLRKLVPDMPIYMCGFTGVRGTAFTMRTMHDWTLEQSILKLMYRRGELLRFEEGPSAPSLYDRIRAAIPDAGDGELAAVTADVFEARLNGLDKLMARLVSILRLPLAVDGWLKRK